MSTVLSTTVKSQGGFDAVDPRGRILAVLVFSILTVVANRMSAVGLAFLIAFCTVFLSRVPLRLVAKRLLPLNVLMALMIVLLPLSTPGEEFFRLGPLSFSRQGGWLGLMIALKGNAVLLFLIGLLGTIDPIVLGHALSHLRVPDKLTHLLLFTVRYLDVLHREYLRLRAAMKTRGFRPRMDRHTLRSFGYLVGMLLVRSFDRAERIAVAMKCRGFRGRFYLLDHFAFSLRDLLFGAISTTFALLLLWMEWK